MIRIEFSRIVGQFNRMASNVSGRDSKSRRRPADMEVGWPLKMSGRADPSFTAPAEKFHPAFSYFNRSYSLQSRSLVRLPFTPAWEKAKRGNLHRLNLYSAGGDDQKWQRETLDLNFLYNPHARISNERSSCPEEGGKEKGVLTRGPLLWRRRNSRGSWSRCLQKSGGLEAAARHKNKNHLLQPK